MGGICTKANDVEEFGQPERRRSVNRIAKISTKEEVVAAIVNVAFNGNSNNSKIPPKCIEAADSSSSTSSDKEEKKGLKFPDGSNNAPVHKRCATMDVPEHRGGPRVIHDSKTEDNLGIVDMPNGVAKENVALGWPAWLASMSAEAIHGWLPRRGDSFEKLDKIGEGTYSHVYRARDLDSGKTVALKKVRFVNMDPESVRFMAREIQILRKLDHRNVIKLEGIVASPMSDNLYLVFEYMEHDLAGLAARSSVRFTEPQVKCLMKQLLEGLAHCHNRGILHRDIKGSNLLVDSNGQLRIGDFGLAALFSPGQQLTSRVVTLWYRPPELLLGATEYGPAVDLWSAGCILAELFAGRPIMPGRTEVEQLHKIFKLCGSPSEEYWEKSKLPDKTLFKPHHQYMRRFDETFKDFPPSALSLLDSLLAIEPEKRGTAASALESKFFSTKPFACEPSSLPKYPPSKEYDARCQQEARRQRLALNGCGSESVKPKNWVARAAPAVPNANGPTNTKNISGMHNPKVNDGVPARETAQKGFSHSGLHPNAFGSALNKRVTQEQPLGPGRTCSSVRVGPQFKAQPRVPDFSDISGPVATRNKIARRNPFDDNDTRGINDLTMAYTIRKQRFQYSGPLLPSGGNMDEILQEHERQIRLAVRKSRVR